jgi:hypothetical protein
MTPHLSNCAVYEGHALACNCRADHPRRYDADILAQYCPTCGRGAGERCKKPTGKEANGPHAPRRTAARHVSA